jgi:hypothetical protein
MPTKMNRKLQAKAVAGIQRQPRIPRPRVSAQPAKDSCNIHSRVTAIVLTQTYPNGMQLLAPAVTGGNADAGGAVLKNYQLYKFQSAKLIYTPSCGSTTSGQVWIGYYDNPEIIYKAWTNVYNTSTKLSLAQTATHSIVTPVWQAAEISAPMTTRRPKYVVDSTNPSTMVEIDAACHGCFIICTNGVPNTEGMVYGSCTLDYQVKGFGIQNEGLTGV